MVKLQQILWESTSISQAQKQQNVEGEGVLLDKNSTKTQL